MTNLLIKLSPIGTITNLGDRSKRRESHTTKGNHRRVYANSMTLSKFTPDGPSLDDYDDFLQIVVMMM